MHRRFPVIYVLLFLVMIGAYYYLNNRPQPADVALTLEPQAEVSYLFSSADGVPVSIRMESKAGEVVEFARNAGNAWAVILPFEASAEQGSAEAAASQITTIRITDRLPNLSPKDVGLDAPDYKLAVKFTNGGERIADIGVITPTENGYYVGIDGEIVIVSRSAIDSLIGLLTNPPYAETLTPLPSSPEAGAATNETATPKP